MGLVSESLPGFPKEGFSICTILSMPFPVIHVQWSHRAFIFAEHFGSFWQGMQTSKCMNPHNNHRKQRLLSLFYG